MVLHYYIIENGVQVGPFELFQLQERYLSAGTPVWHKGMPGWQNAGELPELAPFVHDEDAPPPFKPEEGDEPQTKSVENPQNEIKSFEIEPLPEIEPVQELDNELPPEFNANDFEPVKPIEVTPEPAVEAQPPYYGQQQNNPINDPNLPPYDPNQQCRSSLGLSIFALISVFLLYIIFLATLTNSLSHLGTLEWVPMVAFLAMTVNLVLGIIALVTSIKARLSFNRNYYDISRRRGQTAFVLGLIALIIFIAVSLLCIIAATKV